MVGARRGRVKAAITLALLGGCFWHSAGREAATHVDVMTAIAHKGVDLVVAGRLTAESMPELTYPLERAQAFAARWRGGAAPPWLHAFVDLLDRYRDLVDALDRVRREAKGEAAATALREPLARVDAAADAVRAALAAAGRR
jgi:hypothetical protein